MLRVRAGAVLVVLALLVVNGSRWSDLWPAVQAVVAPPPVTALPAQGLVWGAYDPEGRLAGAGGLDLEQVYLAWNGDPRQITKDVRAIRQRGRVPLVALEPWPAVWAGLTRETLFGDVVAGKYDASIRQSCSTLSRESPQPVLVRWGHEMDLAVLAPGGPDADLAGRYPWANGDAPGFVAAYRHFVATCRATGAANISYVWAPGGDPGLRAYWPGGEYVDYVGTTVLGFAEWDVQRGADRPSTFRELFDPRYELLQGYGKPVLVCELATTGPAEYRQRWIAAAAEAFATYPLLKGVVYFNAVDPVPWGGMGKPDWRIPPGVFPPPLPPPLPPAVSPPGAVTGVAGSPAAPELLEGGSDVAPA
jgi:beta-mannanase